MISQKSVLSPSRLLGVTKLGSSGIGLEVRLSEDKFCLCTFTYTITPVNRRSFPPDAWNQKTHQWG